MYHESKAADFTTIYANLKYECLQIVGSCPGRRLLRQRSPAPPEEQLPSGMLGRRCATLHDCDSSGAVVNVGFLTASLKQ